jgi:hypothetical protein
MQTSSLTTELRIQVPEKIRSALEAYAAERKFSTEFVVEMALSQFLDVDGVTFEDCDPVLNPGKLREQVETLKSQLAQQQSAA